jgi:DNA polymerase I
MMDEPITVDLETEGIKIRPDYPPKPIGLAIRWPGGNKQYLAFGHWDGRNNCSRGTAAAIMRDINRRPEAKLYHNGAFDLDVADVQMGIKPASYIEDSLFLAFLKNPHEQTIALKPLMEKYLDRPPETRDVLREWIVDNVKVNGRKMGKKYKEWGAHICEAPASVVGPYAMDDVENTYQIWRKFRPEIIRRGMFDAYQREISLLPVTLEMERSGVRVAVPRMKKALGVFEEMDNTLIKAIGKKLNIDPAELQTESKNNGGEDNEEFSINRNQLAKAMYAAGKFSHIVKTPTGRMSTKVSVLHETCNDKELLDLLAVHSVANKYITGFLRPWIEQAQITGGRILPKFNQVRARTNDGGGGTRTGRYSSSDPNLQTVTANVEESKNKDTLLLMQKWLKNFYHYEFIGLRDFFLPDEGMLIAAVDYNQQELRLFAHFEEGLLMQAYWQNPRLDVHEHIRQLIYKATGKLYERKAVKILVFGMLYGMGLEKLSLSLEQPRKVAAAIRDGLFKAVPGIGKLMKALKHLANRHLPLRTWGGREYFCEEPVWFNNQWISFEYKMLNQLIQPSAADMTKQGMLNVREEVPQARIAIQVHDELVCMVPHRKYGPKIAEAMVRGKFNVPMLADAKYSSETWARVTK